MSQLKELRKSIMLGIFISLMMIFILPVWLTHSFVTINGPFDFYLAQVYFELSNPESAANLYYSRLPVEFSGSFELALMYIKSGFGSNTLFDKLLFSIWIAAFLMLCRNISLALNSKADYRPFLFFSIVFCVPLINGDWNFLGAVLFFLSGLKALISIHQHSNLLQIFTIVFLSAFFLLWCSFFWFLIYSSLCAIVILFNHNKALRRQFIWITFAPVPAIVLPALFFHISAFNFSIPEFETRFENLLSFKLLQTFPKTDWWITIPLAVLFAVLWIFSIVKIFYDLKPNLVYRFWHRITISFSIVCVLVFLFIENDSNSNFGFTFIFLAALFLLFSLSCLRIKKIYMLSAGLFCLIITIMHLRMQFLAWDSLSLKAAEYQSVLFDNKTNPNLQIVYKPENPHEQYLPYLLRRSNPNLIIFEPARSEQEYNNRFILRRKQNIKPELNLLPAKFNANQKCITSFAFNKTSICKTSSLAK